MATDKQSKGKHTTAETRKPFLTGLVADERTLKSSLAFFGTLILVFFIAFIACATATFSNLLLRIFLNAAVVILALIVFFNNGSKRGAEDVAKGEILWQKKEKGLDISESERKLCFHPFKGYVIGVAGTLPFILLALYLAVNTSLQMTGSGTLPSWMQTYTKRGDIGNALINYTQPEGMAFIDYIRMIVRIMMIPFVNIAGNADKNGILLVERLSPLLLLLPAAAYGSGYLTGRSIRTQIHTAINVNDQKRIRREKKRRNARNRAAQNREPEKLN